MKQSLKFSRVYSWLDELADRPWGASVIIYMHLLKTELRISDFQHFHWLAGHRLSVHIPAVPNMVKERVSNKVSWKHFCSSAEKKWPTKAGLDRN